MKKQKQRPGSPPPKPEDLPVRRQNPGSDKAIEDIVKRHEKRKDSRDYTQNRREQSRE